jgi:hypothetical protein
LSGETDSLKRPRLLWKEGTHPEETCPDGSKFRWCKDKWVCDLDNRNKTTQRLRFSFGLLSYYPGPFEVHLTGPLISRTIMVDHSKPHYRIEIDVPPGQHSIHWSTNAETYVHPARSLNVGIVDPKLELCEPKRQHNSDQVVRD